MPIIVALLICGIITKEKKNALCEIIKPKRNIFYKLTWYLGSVRFGLKYFMENEFCFLFYLVHLEFVSQRKILSWPMDFFFKMLSVFSNLTQRGGKRLELQSFSGTSLLCTPILLSSPELALATDFLWFLWGLNKRFSIHPVLENYFQGLNEIIENKSFSLKICSYVKAKRALDCHA